MNVVEPLVKHRIVGALVIIALGAIFLPLLFRGSEYLQTNIVVPHIPKTPPKPDISTLTITKKAKIQTVNKIETDVSDKQKQVPVNLGWIIQLATFKDLTHAKALTLRLQKQHYNAYIQTEHLAKEELYRVLVGPMMTLQDAKNTQLKLKSMVKLSGIILQFNPKEMTT